MVESDSVLQLCKIVAGDMGNTTWPQVMQVVEELKDEEPESVRIRIAAYLAKAIQGAKTDKQAVFFLERLAFFSRTYYQSDGKAQLLLSIGEAKYQS
jgi:hypothetical protein